MTEKFIFHDFRDLKRCNINFSMDADATVAIDDAPRASWMDGWMDGWDWMDGTRLARDRVRHSASSDRANERRRRGTMYVDAGIVSRAGVAVGGTSATMRTHLRGDRAGRGDGVRRPMTTRTTRMTVARRKGEEKTRGKKGDKRDKRGSNKKNGAKKLKPPMDGGRTLKIGPTYVEVPEAIPRMLEQTPRPALYAGGAIVVLLLQKLLFGKRSGSRGSLGDLEERGMLDENREVDEEKFFKGMMKSVRTIEMPELTEEQILAARERRRQSAGGNENFEKSLAEAEIPANLSLIHI